MIYSVDCTHALETVSKILYQKRIGSDLHCHFEGILHFTDLLDVAESISDKKLFSKSTWKSIEEAMSNDEKTLAAFFSKLTAGWIRLICITAYLKYNIPIKISLRAFIEKALSKMYVQGIASLELMISVFTLSSDGDFNIIPIPPSTVDEIQTYITQWNNRVEKVQAPNINELIDIFKEVIESNHLYRLATEKQKIPRRMTVGLKYMIRREKDLGFRNRSISLKKRVEQIEDLFNRHLIVGVDVAGNEYDPGGCVSNYREFLELLSQRNIPFTVHAGEIAPDSLARDISYENLRSSIYYGAKRIGHAVRLFDNSEKKIQLLQYLVIKGVFIELNMSSNIWTGAVASSNMYEHPIIKALNGKHPLFKKHPKLLEKLRKLVIVCDDDPVVVANGIPSIHQELAIFSTCTNNLGLGSVEKLLEQQQLISLQAKLW